MKKSSGATALDFDEKARFPFDRRFQVTTRLSSSFDCLSTPTLTTPLEICRFVKSERGIDESLLQESIT
jgi:hypothetical protein